MYRPMDKVIPARELNGGLRCYLFWDEIDFVDLVVFVKFLIVSR